MDHDSYTIEQKLTNAGKRIHNQVKIQKLITKIGKTRNKSLIKTDSKK